MGTLGLSKWLAMYLMYRPLTKLNYKIAEDGLPVKKPAENMQESRNQENLCQENSLTKAPGAAPE
jgi:hypothetical protein